jgi:hypothetical protein
MGGGVTKLFTPVVIRGNHRTLAHKDRTDGDLTPLKGHPGLFKGQGHVFFI